MSRSINVAGMLDIRTTVIHHDVTVVSNPCVAGPRTNEYLSRLYTGDSSILNSGPGEVGYYKKNGVFKRKTFDTYKDFVADLSAFVILSTIFGIIQSYAAFLPNILKLYDIGAIEGIILGAGTYGTMIFCGPISNCIISRIGTRLTCIAGMLLFFSGCVIDSLALSLETLYVSHFFLLAVGGSLACTAAASSIVDRFRRKLSFALLLLAIASPCGTIFYYSLLHFFLLKEVAYGWGLIMISIIVLVLTAATFVFPIQFQKHHHVDPFNLRDKDRVIKTCVEKSARAKACLPIEDESKGQASTCFMICICDVAMCCDLSFLLWSSLAFFAMLSIFIPYLFLMSYAAKVHIPPAPTTGLILWYSLSSIIGRVSILGRDFTFKFNRLLFQVCVIGSGILSIVFTLLVDTFGWTIIWSLVAGGIEGVLTIAIPRLTLQTIPRNSLSFAWGYLAISGGLALFTGVAVIICTWTITHGFALGYVTIGIMQIIAGIFAFLLPNEEAQMELFLANNLTLFRETNYVPQMKLNKMNEPVQEPAMPLYPSSSQPPPSVPFSYEPRSTPGRARTAVQDCIDRYLGGNPIPSSSINCPVCERCGCLPGPDCCCGVTPVTKPIFLSPGLPLSNLDSAYSPKIQLPFDRKVC